MGIIIRLLVLATVAGIAVAGYTTYRIWDQGGRDEQQPADAIVVMGAAQYDGRPSPVFAARLDHAVALFRAGVAPRLVVTGGKAEGDRTTEAASARAYAIARGVAPEHILVEDRSRTTLESIRGVADLMDDAGLSSAVFVSDPSHMFRVLRMADDAGITAWGSPTRTSPIDADPAATVDALIHEIGGLAAYLLGGGTVLRGT